MNGSESGPADGARAGVHGLVARQVAARPDACAVRDTRGRELTYARLWRLSGLVAARLAHRGVGPGSRVAVAMERGTDLVAALLGVLRTGAAYVPLDPRAPAERREAVVRDCRADAVLAADGLWAAPRDGEAAPPLVEAGPLLAPAPDTVPQPAAGALPDGQAAAEPPRPVRPDDAAFIGYTSGSTGRPKGVELSHRALTGFVTGARYCPLGPGDRVAQVANPSFDPVTFEVWSTLAAGATVVVLPAVAEVPLTDWVAQLARHRITVMFLTTALVDMVHRAAPGAFAPLRTLLFGGESVDPETVRGLCAVDPPEQVLHVYGPTEATTFTTFFRCTPASVAGLDRVPIGFPLHETTLHVLDDGLRAVPDGEPGELCIGGPRIATGYLGQPVLTGERFVVLPGGERVYRSGDLVRRRPADGALEFLGRKDRQVKLRGFRIELEEVERALLATGLVDSAVVEKTGDGMAAGLVGFVVPGRRAAGTASEEVPRLLSRALRTVLPHYMVPTRWHLAPALPVTRNGKVDRAALLAGLRSTGAAAGG